MLASALRRLSMRRLSMGRLSMGLLVVSLTLAACTTGSASTAASSSAPPPIPSPTSTGALTKSEFIKQANAMCSATNQQLTALPQAKGRTDYPALLTDFTSTLTIYQSYFTDAEALVNRSPDREKLTQKWLTVEQGDYNASKPIIEQMIQALQAKDDAGVDAAQSKLKDAPDHTSSLITFFKSYGLGDCANLESGDS